MDKFMRYGFKVTLLCLITTFSTMSAAGTLGDVKSTFCYTCVSDWEISGQALWLHPTFSRGFLYTIYLRPHTNDAVTTTADPGWGYGFKIGAALHFRENDLNLNWYHFGNTSNQNLQSVIGASQQFTALMGNYHLLWNAINVELGEMLSFDNKKRIRVYAGAQFAQINSRAIEQPLPNQLQFIPESLFVKFSGGGPRIGADFFYDVGTELSFSANIATALLVGNNSFAVYTTNAIFAAGSNTGTNATIIVPDLEGKLGASYTKKLLGGELSAEAGYLWQDYISALGHTSPLNNIANITSINLSFTSNFMLNGVYFGLKWVY